jgi:hypothetical protein
MGLTRRFDVWICAFLTVLCAVGGVAAIADGSPGDGLWMLLGGAVFGTLWWYVRQQRQRLQAFQRWIGENTSDIERGRARWNGQVVTSYTEVRQFTFCVSFVFMTVRVSSCPLFAHENVGSLRLVYGLLTTLFGWWGLPWGPIHSVSALVNNARGGTRVPLHDLRWE